MTRRRCAACKLALDSIADRHARSCAASTPSSAMAICQANGPSSARLRRACPIAATNSRGSSWPRYKLLLLAGDGIGPEVMAEVKRLHRFIAKRASPISHRGGAGRRLLLRRAQGRDHRRRPWPRRRPPTRCIFGAVGGPKWDKVPYDVRPEAGLLRLRKDLGLFANIRPAICYPALADASSLKREAGRGPRHHHPARADRRRLFRRAEDHHRSRQRPEARHRYPGLRHLRDRAHLARRLRAGAQARATRSRRWKSATS